MRKIIFKEVDGILTLEVPKNSKKITLQDLTWGVTKEGAFYVAGRELSWVEFIKRKLRI